ncbi:MAG: hypothetical protein HC940_03375 [Acaryochloris sp. SU_5_25]|nr:hypothetical protein [Acaryochloris sp. SU_5_25]
MKPRIWIHWRMFSGYRSQTLSSKHLPMGLCQYIGLDGDRDTDGFMGLL